MCFNTKQTLQKSVKPIGEFCALKAMEHGVVLCEIAEEISPECPEEPAEFTFGKRRWRAREFLTEEAEAIGICIQGCQEARTRKLSFKAVKHESGLWKLVLFHDQRIARARPAELQMADILLPLIFRDYTPSLEFEVAEQERLHQRPLKTYVTTKLFDALYDRHLKATNVSQDQKLLLPNRFKSKLRKYQERTVTWMLQREQKPTEITANYTPLYSVDGISRVFKHNYCLQFYAHEDALPKILLPPGGILADEMGLGKTVEFLAMLLMNPRPPESCRNTYWHTKIEEIESDVPLKLMRKGNGGEAFCVCTYKKGTRVQCSKCRLWQHKRCMNSSDDIPHLCPNCWADVVESSGRLVETGATFIVSPNAIKMQWFREMKKHISPNLKVLVYRGLHTGAGNWYSPLHLAEYDVVLTDYVTLRNEIYHTADFNSDRQLRHQRLYMRSNSPLLMVNWWRVCLDEAQMVESNTSAAAEMVRKLPAVNRWAVTGTIDDLPPLLEFVGRTEATQPPDAWKTVHKAFQLNHQTEPLLDLLHHSLWRTCKSRVEHELGIPPQMELVHRLELSNVEALYYREEHFKCHEQFLTAVAKHTRHNPDNSSCLASISPQLLRVILKPFLRIRQTCSVPVMHNSTVSSTDYLNPQDLLERLKSNNETECKSELRSWASSYNGLAAIHFIREDFPQAIRHYKLLLKLAADYNKDSISVDSVLQIHAIYNLLQASDAAAPCERVSESEKQAYESQMKRLEWKYLQDNVAVLQAALGSYESKLNELEESGNKFKDNVVHLLATVVNHQPALHNSIWNKVRDDFARKNISMKKLVNVDSMSGMVYVVDLWFQKVQNLNEHVIKEIEFLKEIMESACGAIQMGATLSQDMHNFIATVTDCHLADILDDKPNDNPEKPKKPRHCRLCKIRDCLNQFECLVFAKELDDDAEATEGLEVPSMEISLITSIFNFLRSKPAFADWQTELQHQLDFLTCLQSVVKLQIKYWIEVEYMVKAFDELEMCKMRILLTDDPDEQSNYRILACQLDEQLQFNQVNLQESQLNFTRLFGRLKYLKHLKEDATDKPCPICQTHDDLRYVMMVCGHFVCQLCLENMKKSTLHGISKCPICRQDSPQLYYSVRREAGVAIAGDFSTKISSIVEQLLKIRSAGPHEKILIFSQWQAILFQISKALALNKIEFRSKCVEQDFADFKNPDLNITCLLMPLSKGSKGLNLIEATHVFLVEPILNPGDEKQAIGRIHRFGQTKPTKVHRFIVNGTIEENILSLIASADDTKTLSTHWDLENMTLEGLKKLFILRDTN